MNAYITLEADVYTEDATGRLIVRYTPILRPGTLASGELRFATWECPLLDGPDAHNKAMRDARASASNAMQVMAREVA
jgi:hypothetical protein